MASDAVVLSSGMLRACLEFGAGGEQGKEDMPTAMAALQFVLAHELAHIYLRHRVRGEAAQLHRMYACAQHSSRLAWLAVGKRFRQPYMLPNTPVSRLQSSRRSSCFGEQHGWARRSWRIKCVLSLG